MSFKSSGNIAVEVRGLSKSYTIDHNDQGHTTLSESLIHRLRNPISRHTKETFWAIKNLDFDVQRGEVVGIIGRNGAGKSTFLKVLSQITDPTSGYVNLFGRVGSLLEVGTGFHPELTGRENIYLNGAILGMRTRDIERHFDDIVEFAQVERFLDTPVKRYSSGMYVRLAFAVAAHLDSDILVVDEVLAVGDVEFQKKCMGKMGQVAKQDGRTVLFVSHNMTAVAALCQRAILLRDGGLVLDGPTSEVTAAYQELASQNVGAGGSLEKALRSGTGAGRFSSVSIQPVGRHGEPLSVAVTGCDLIVETTIECPGAGGISYANTALIIYDSNYARLIDVNTGLKGEFLNLSQGQQATVRFDLRDLLLRPGNYYVGLWLAKQPVEEYDHIELATSFSIAEPESANHAMTWPGPYQCRFDCQSTLVEPAAPGSLLAPAPRRREAVGRIAV